MTGYIKSWHQRETLAWASGQVAQRMERACALVARKAAALAPRRTGRLVAGIDVVVEMRARENYIEGVVGVHKRVFWAIFQERGTRHHAAHPFLRPAVFGSARDILRILGS